MWVGKVDIDSDKTNVGTATATWTDGAFTFTYSRRVRLTTAERDAFVAEAKAALTTRQAKDTSNTNFSTQLTTALNA